MNNTLTYPTRTEPAMPYELLLYTGTFYPVQPIKRTKAIIKYFFCVGLIIFCMFVVSITLKGGATRLISVAGFFISAHIIQRYSTPAWCVNAPTALEVIDSGKGCTVLYYSPN